MTKLLTGGVLVLLVAGSFVSGSLFGPFGPFAPAGQLPGALAPGFGGAVGGYPGALPMYPGRPGVGQLPLFPPGLYPPVAYLPGAVPPTPVAPAVFGRALVGPSTVAPAAATGNLRNVATNADVLGRLAVADLPEDLQQRAQDLQTASDQGFDACEQLLTTTGGSYWQYKRCNALQLRTVLTAAKALEQEATARATAAAAAASADQTAEAAPATV
ncbi:uncharacterized protein LOC128307190 [Anopheles moucheti]|uniref:uncharacterized protein LOC128307190 n=1 Tax=Anopheles moucheti TaxID=186751 RepID=UPI0022F0930A|nr:uncharacterized protein LOC128307190 [Anopheles moucheti]